MRGQRRRGYASREAICQAVRELLSIRRLDELQVSEIVERAGISRPTFYAHFETKYSVVAALIEDNGRAVFDSWRPFFDGDGPIEEREIRELGMVTIGHWRSQAALWAATIEGWHTDQEIHEVWNEVLERFAAALTERIRRYRPLRDDDDMVVEALIALFERCVYLAITAPESALGRSDEDLASVLARLWSQALAAG
jgi:AcrR family transcriptional regulator